MQDLFAEAGLSSGAVYRYFSGKDDMVMAIAEENIRDVLDVIRALAAGQPDRGLATVLGDVLLLVTKKQEEAELAPLSVLVWAEALRSPQLAERFGAAIAQLRDELAEAVRGYQAEGSLPRDASTDGLTRLFVAIVAGYILQLALFGADDVAGLPDAITALWPA
jgi:AcrR family transcriptional regulator